MTAFDRVQAARIELFGRVAALPEPMRRMRTEAGAWTPLELLEHLVREDRHLVSRPAVRKGSATRNPLFPIITRWARRGWRIPVTAPMLEPTGGWSYEEAAAASDAVHRELARVVSAAGADEIVAASPFVGTLTSEQLCDAIEAHYQYHLKRLKLPGQPELAASGTPAGELPKGDSPGPNSSSESGNFGSDEAVPG